MTDLDLGDIVDRRRYPLESPSLRAACRATLARDGALLLPRFLTAQAIATVRREAAAHRHLAYFCTQRHNVFLMPPDPAFAATHPRNREVVSSKGCITDNQVPTDSPLRALYTACAWRSFLCAVLEEDALHAYADPLSSINVHYAEGVRSSAGISITPRLPSRC